MSKEFRIYKPTKAQNGAASKFQVSVKKIKEKYEEVMLFWEMAEQTGIDENNNASFDWTKPEKDIHRSITMKLGSNDVGELLCVLSGKKEFVGRKKEEGLFHQNQSGNTILKFAKMDRGGYYAALSAKRSGVLMSIKHSLTDSEGTILEQLLKDFVSSLYKWK